MRQYLFRRVVMAAFLRLFVLLVSFFLFPQIAKAQNTKYGPAHAVTEDPAAKALRESYKTIPKPIKPGTRTYNPRKTNTNNSSTDTNNTSSAFLPKPTAVKEPDYYQREAGSCICNAKPLSEVKFVVADNGTVNYFSPVAKGFVMKSRAGNDYIVAVPEYNGSSALLNRRYDVYYVNYTSSGSSGQINTGKRMFYLDPSEVSPFFNDRYSGQELQDLERRVMEKTAPFFKQGARVQFNVKTGPGTTRLTGWRMYINLRDSVFIAVPDPKAINKGNIYMLNLAGNYYNETAVLLMPYEVPMKSASDYELIGDFVNNKFSLRTTAFKRDLERINAEEAVRTKPIYTANKTFNTTIETAAPYTLMKYVLSPALTLDSGYKLNFAGKDSFLIANYVKGNGSGSVWNVLLFRYENGAGKSTEYTFPRIETVLTNADSVSIPGPAAKGIVQPPKTDFLKKLEESAIKIVRNRMKNFNFIGTAYTGITNNIYNEYHFGIVTLNTGEDYMGVFAVDGQNWIVPNPVDTYLPGVIFSNGKITNVGFHKVWGKQDRGLYLYDYGVFSILPDEFGKWYNSPKIKLGGAFIATKGDFSVPGDIYHKGMCTVYKSDETKISGPCIDSLPDGLCNVWTADGKYYEALFSKGEPIGDKGASFHRVKNPPGTQFFKKTNNIGDVYIGDWLDGVKQGYGTLRLASGTIWRGNFSNDMSTSPGYWTFPDGTQSSGDYAVYTNGDVYYGTILGGKREGPGCLVLTNGNVQYGIFKGDDLPDGNGMMAFKNGDLARGVIKNGKLEGDVLYIEKAKRTVTHQKYFNGVRVD